MINVRNHLINNFSKLNTYKIKYWNHVCIYGSKITPSLGVSINGEHLFKHNHFPTEKFGGSLHLLSSKSEFNPSAFGKFTDLNIWNKVLSLDEINNMSKTLVIKTEPILKWSDVKMDSLNFEDDYENDESILSNIPENLFLFKMKTFIEGIHICQSIGGEIATPSENTKIETWNNITTRHNLGRVFLSYSDQIVENDFRNVYTGNKPLQGMSLTECPLSVCLLLACLLDWQTINLSKQQV